MFLLSRVLKQGNVMKIEDEIIGLNLAFLTLLRECAIRKDDAVSVYFGVGNETASLIADCPATELLKIAQPGVLLFSPRTTPAQLHKLIELRGAPLEVARTVAKSLSN
jgi:hypothetical protein